MSQQTSNNTSTEKAAVSQGTDPQVSIASIGAKAAIIVAIIGLIGTLAGLFLNYLQWSSSLATPVPTANNPPVAVFTPSSLPTLTDPSSPTPVQVVPLTEAPTLDVLSSTATPTSSAAARMYVKIAANQTTGKVPLTVKLDARNSYVQAPDGTIFGCSKGACRYRWSISLGGQAIALPNPGEGTLNFKFQEKGTYVISVYICHGSESPTCGNGYTLVIVN